MCCCESNQSHGSQSGCGIGDYSTILSIRGMTAALPLAPPFAVHMCIITAYHARDDIFRDTRYRVSPFVSDIQVVTGITTYAYYQTIQRLTYSVFRI